jgi:hypothetical protein
MRVGEGVSARGVIVRRHPANDDRSLGLINSDKSAGRDLKAKAISRKRDPLYPTAR